MKRIALTACILAAVLAGFALANHETRIQRVEHRSDRIEVALERMLELLERIDARLSEDVAP